MVDEERLELVSRHVAIARRHVAQSQNRISAHYQPVLKLQAAGENSHDAELLLHSLLQTHQLLRASLAVEEMMQDSDQALVFAALDERRTACLT